MTWVSNNSDALVYRGPDCCALALKYHRFPFVIPVLVAAGYSGTDACSTLPVAYPETIAVGAIADYDGKPGGLCTPSNAQYGADDTRASFSNYGPVVTIYVPGVDVLSDLPGNQTARWSGTSMATPHATGAVLLFLKNHPGTAPSTIANTLVKDGEPGSWRQPNSSQPLLNVANSDFGPTTPPATVHDVESTSITAPSPVVDGVATTVTVHVQNKGSVTESGLNLTLTDTTQNVTLGPTPPAFSLDAGAATDITFNWTPSGAGTHSFTAHVSNGGTIDHSDNGSIDVAAVSHNVAVSNVQVQTQPAYVNVANTVTGVVTNNGNVPEALSVVLSDTNATIDTTFSIALDPGQSQNVSFSWTPTATGSHDPRITASNGSISASADYPITVTTKPVNQTIWVTGLSASNPSRGTLAATVSIGGPAGAVANATVTLSIQGPFLNTTVQVTKDSSGTARYSARVNSWWGGTYTVTVTNVAHGSDTYDSSQNVKTSVSVYVR